MDEIADCIADHQYGEAIRKSGVGDPLDNLAASIIERIPDSPVVKDPDERAKQASSFKSELTLQKMMDEPIGRYMLAWESFQKNKIDEDTFEGITKMFNSIEDFALYERPDAMDVQVIVDTMMEFAPDQYRDRLDAISEECRTQQEAFLEKEKQLCRTAAKSDEQAQDVEGNKEEKGEEIEGTEPVVPGPNLMRHTQSFVQRGPVFNQVFDEFKENIQKEVFEPMFAGFKDSELCAKYCSIKWYSKEPVTVDSFIVFRDLGRGAFGVVSGGRMRTTGEMVALKGMNRKLVKGKKVKKLVKGEKDILKLLGERPSYFCVWLKYSFMDAHNMYFALPLMTGGDLQYHLRREPSRSFGIERSRFYAAQIMLGLAHMHALGIVYRDLKPENVLLDDKGHTRISDMGLAVNTKFTPKTRKNRTIKGRAGTPGYWPPQMIKGEGYAFDADWWSFGCCVYEFMSGSCPFGEHNTRMKDRNEGTLHWSVQFPEPSDPANKFTEEIKDLVLKLLQRDPMERLGSGPESAEFIMSHPFFESIDWKKFTRNQVDPPWSPPSDAINAVSQADLEDRNKEFEYRKLKLTEEDDIANFEYVNDIVHQRDICMVMHLDRLGKLDHLAKNKGSTTCNLL